MPNIVRWLAYCVVAGGALLAGGFGATCDCTVAEELSALASPNGIANGRDTLAPYWPFGLAPSTWQLTNKVGKVALIVTYLNPEANILDLMFAHPLNSRFNHGRGGFNIGEQRYCDNNGDPYLFLDQYVGVNADGSVNARHHIVSSRLILTPDSGAPIDLIANGTYARCGNIGQPYLKWNLGTHKYRLQAWGALSENPNDLWYWDIIVTAPVKAINTCMTPPRQFTAVQVQEAWWTNFDKIEKNWALGSGTVDASGVPTGDQVTYGRTDWHAEGHMPWYMVESTDGHLICVTSVQTGTIFPVGQLCRPPRPNTARDCALP